MRSLLFIGLILMFSGLLVWAHDDDEDPDHHNEMDTGAAVVPENPTYYEHIKPLLERHCVACHREGQISGDIPLTDPQDVEQGASDIAFNASIGYMPPWMPSRLSLPMKHDRSLTDTEIATLVAWSDQGAPLGDPEAYTPPEEPPYQLTEIRADLTLQLDEPYLPDESVRDDYRCFAFPLDMDGVQYVTGYEFLPGVPAMAHHGIVYLMDAGALSGVERRNFEDGRAGWQCYGGVGLPGKREMIGTWAPGTLPIAYPEGTGYRIEPDDILILQMHYNLSESRQPDQTTVNLQLADGDLSIGELMNFELVAPVEIPCPTGVEGAPCERATALERIADLYGQDLSYFPDALLRDCDQTLADYAGNTGENATGYCDYTTPVPLTIYGVFGHMHELGRSFQMELNPDRDAPRLMLDIPNWDFHWQDAYQFAEPLQIEAGDTVRMTCNWDNTLSEEPRYVVWGEGTADEMCFGTMIVLKS